MAISVNAGSSIEFTSLRIYRTDISNITDYLRKLFKPYGVVDVLTSEPVNPSGYTPATTPGIGLGLMMWSSFRT